MTKIISQTNTVSSTEKDTFMINMNLHPHKIPDPSTNFCGPHFFPSLNSTPKIPPIKYKLSLSPSVPRKALTFAPKTIHGFTTRGLRGFTSVREADPKRRNVHLPPLYLRLLQHSPKTRLSSTRPNQRPTKRQRQRQRQQGDSDQPFHAGHGGDRGRFGPGFPAARAGRQGWSSAGGEVGHRGPATSRDLGGLR